MRKKWHQPTSFDVFCCLNRKKETQQPVDTTTFVGFLHRCTQVENPGGGGAYISRIIAFLFV